MHRLRFEKVWNWAFKQDGFREGMGRNPTTRALAALTHLLSPYTYLDPSALFWALVGIEALYRIGPIAASEQIREKVWLFLGAQESFKKKITTMYNFRSRFVHGDMTFLAYEPSESFWAPQGSGEFKDELADSTSLAVGILLASLQELIQRDWKGLRFSYDVGDSRE